MFMKKLVLIDSDGTLRKDNGNVSLYSKLEIFKNRKCGNYVILATGRPRYHSILVSKRNFFYPIVVSSHGAEIYNYETKEVLYGVYLDKEICKLLIEFANKEDIRIAIAIKNLEYVNKKPINKNQVLFSKFEDIENSDYIQSCMFIDSLEKINIARDFLKKSNIKETDFYEEKDGRVAFWISVSNENATKGNALKFLEEYLDINHKDTYAIGNGYNDISMIKAAYHGLVVANAYSYVRKHSDMVIDSNNKDGIRKFLKSIRKNR